MASHHSVEKQDHLNFHHGEEAFGQELHQEKTQNTMSTEMGEEEDDDFKVTFTACLAFAGIALGFSADIAAAVMASAVLSRINEDLGPTSNYVWMVSANYVATSILSPFVGRLSDIFGRRNLLLLGNAIAMIANIVSATATNTNAVIAGSVMIGVSAAMHQLGWVCVGEIVPRKQRALSLGLLEVSVTPLSIFGPLIAFQFVDKTGPAWRSIYWLGLGLNFTAFALILFFYHPLNQYVREVGKSRWDQVKSLDYVGFALFTVGLCLFLLGLSFGGNTFPWVSAGTLAPLLIGALFLVATGLWENFTHNPYNMFPHAVMQDFRGFSLLCGITFLIGMLYYSTLILWPSQISIFYTQDPTKIGLYSLSSSTGGLVGGILGAIAMRFINQARWMLTGIIAAMTVFCGCQATIGLDTGTSSAIIVGLVGITIAAATVVSNTMIQLAVPHQYLGVAMGIVVTARSVGGSVATTIYTTILSNQVSSNLGSNVGAALGGAGVAPANIPAIIGALATGNVTSPALGLATLEQLGAGVLALKSTYRDAFKVIYLVSIAFGILGLLCAVFTQNVGHLMTNKIDVKIETGLHLTVHEAETGGHVINHDGTELSRKAIREAARANATSQV